MKPEELRIYRQERRQLEKLIRKYNEKYCEKLEREDLDRLIQLHNLYEIKFGRCYKG